MARSTELGQRAEPVRPDKAFNGVDALQGKPQVWRRRRAHVWTMDFGSGHGDDGYWGTSGSGVGIQRDTRSSREEWVAVGRAVERRRG